MDGTKRVKLLALHNYMYMTTKDFFKRGLDPQAFIMKMSFSCTFIVCHNISKNQLGKQ